MKNPYSVLHEKEHDLDRVRNEVQALLTVIPLLQDEELPLTDMIETLDNGMADLAVYYPFVRNLRNSGKLSSQKHQENSNFDVVRNC